MLINQHIKKHRLENHLSQEMLANQMNISRQSISKWERGESLPSIDNLVRLSEILAIPLDELVKGKEVFPIPFDFGKNNSKALFVGFVLITILVCVVVATLTSNTLAVGVAFLYCYGMVSVVSIINFKDYYNYFTIRNQGIEVYDGTRAFKIKATLSAFAKKRKIRFIPYENIKSLELYFNNKGYNSDTHEGLNYRRRQTHVGREAFNLYLTTIDGDRYELSLDRLFYPQTEEYRYFLAIMTYFKKHQILVVDVYGILGALEKEHDLIEAAYYETA